jgi:hypothetical protein
LERRLLLLLAAVTNTNTNTATPGARVMRWRG